MATRQSKQVAPPESLSLSQILEARGAEYGKFTEHAECTQAIKHTLHTFAGFNENYELDADHHEAADMIAHKLGRIVCGNPNNEDSWRDIAGYATLVADRLSGKSI
jgi:Domain of unknown function (DUF6378)